MDISKNFSKLSSDGATLAKVIATFSVVLTHAFKLFEYMEADEAQVFFLPGFHAFASCGVPVFFLLSGYFLACKGNWDYRKNLKKKFNSLVVPYIIFMLLYATISCVGSLVLPRFFDDFRKFSAYEWMMRLFGIPFVIAPRFYGPLWFLRELFIFNLVSFALVPIVKKIPGYILIPAMTAVYFLPFSHIVRFSVPFFIIGMYFGFRKEIPVPNNWALTILLLIAGFLAPVLPPPLAEFGWKLSVFLMTVFVLSISGKLSENSSFVKLGKNAIPFSFPVFLLHEYPITTLMRLLALNSPSISVAATAVLTAPFFVIFLCVIIIIVWKRTLPRTYAICTGGRY